MVPVQGGKFNLHLPPSLAPEPSGTSAREIEFLAIEKSEPFEVPVTFRSLLEVQIWHFSISSGFAAEHPSQVESSHVGSLEWIVLIVQIDPTSSGRIGSPDGE